MLAALHCGLAGSVSCSISGVLVSAGSCSTWHCATAAAVSLAVVAAHSELTDVFKIRMFAVITTACFFDSIVDVALLVTRMILHSLTHQGELNKYSS